MLFRRYLKILVVFVLLVSCQPPPPDLPASTPDEGSILYELTTNIDPLGAGVIAPSSGYFLPGDEKTLRAQTNSGYTFDHWSGDVSGNSPEVTIHMDADKTVTAHFTRVSRLKKFELDEISYSSSHSGNIIMDFDSDGDLDLILNQFDWPPPQEPQAVLAYRNDGNGKFTKATKEVFANTPLVTTTARHWAIEDFNGDGRDDLFIADSGQDHEPNPGGQSLILIQNENGQLIDETQARLPQQMAFTHNVATGDIDQDGDVDIYLCNISGGTQIGPRFYINDGDGFFSEDTTRIPGEMTRLERKFTASLLLDVDQDDDLDLVLGGHDNAGVRDVILLNDGAGIFSYPPEESMPPRLGGAGFETVQIVSDDLDKDGWPDLLLSTHLAYQFDANMQLLMNNGDGTFRDETFRIEQDWSFYRNPEGCGSETDGWLTELNIVDANNDTWPDILVQGDSCLHHLLFLSEAGEHFVVTENYSQLLHDGSTLWSLVPGDVDNDGNLDVVLLYTSMTQQIYLRLPSEEKQVILSPPNTPTPTASTMPPVLSFQDEFDDELQPGWEWVSDDEPHWSLSDSPGHLQITLWTGYQKDNLLRPAPEKFYEIETKLSFEPASNSQKAGLIIYQDEDNYMYLSRGFCQISTVPGMCIGNGFYFNKRWKGVVGWSNYATRTESNDEAYLKIRQEGNKYTAFYSTEGETWIEIGTHTADFDPIRIGLTAGGSSYAINADFDYFMLYEFP